MVYLGISGLAFVETIGRDDFGTIHRARESGTDRLVAVRLFEGASTGPRFQEFDRECRTVASLAWCPQIFPIRGSGVNSAGVPYLVTDDCPGGTPADRVRHQGPLGENEVRHLAKDLASALQVAHGVGVVHGLVRPECILVTSSGQPALSEFGFARYADILAASASASSAGSSALSRSAYAAPELRHGAPASPASDVFSLGATLLDLLTGPVADDPGRGPEREVGAVSSPAEQRGEQVAQLPVSPELRAVLGRCLSPDPALRYPDASSLIADLDRVDQPGAAGHHGVAAPSPGTEPGVGAAAPLTAPGAVWSQPLATEATIAAPAAGGSIPPATQPASPSATWTPPAAVKRTRAPLVWVGAAVLAGVLVVAAGLAVASATATPTVRLMDRSIRLVHGITLGPALIGRSSDFSDIPVDLLSPSTVDSLRVGVPVPDEAAEQQLRDRLQHDATPSPPNLSVQREDWPTWQVVHVKWDGVDTRPGVKTTLADDAGDPVPGCPTEITGPGECTVNAATGARVSVTATARSVVGERRTTDAIMAGDAPALSLTLLPPDDIEGKRYCIVEVRAIGMKPNSRLPHSMTFDWRSGRQETVDYSGDRFVANQYGRATMQYGAGLVGETLKLTVRVGELSSSIDVSSCR